MTWLPGRARDPQSAVALDIRRFDFDLHLAGWQFSLGLDEDARDLGENS
jgi:hypothetical protein